MKSPILCCKVFPAARFFPLLRSPFSRNLSLLSRFSSLSSLSPPSLVLSPSGAFAEIDKFNDNDFVSWRRDVQLALKVSDLWTVVDGDDLNLQCATRDAKARSWILLKRSKDIESTMEQPTSAELLRAALDAQYNERTQGQFVRAIRQLFTCAPELAQPMAAFFAKCTKLAHELSSCGFTVPDTVIAAIMVSTSPEQYEALPAHFDAADGDLNLAAVKSMI